MRRAIQRRTFLQLAGLLMAGAMTRKHTMAAAAKPRVVIVGAGMAGMAAAHTLSQQGYDPLLLEGRDRIGGRVWTSSQWQGMPVDLGASWIHGVKGNPLTQLAKDAKARTAATNYASSLLYGADGKPITTQGERQLERWQGELDDAIAWAQDQDDDRSIQAAVEEQLDWASLAPAERQLVDFLVNSTMEQEYGGSSTALSAHWFDDGKFFGGDDAFLLDGYGTLIQHLAKGRKVQLGETVTRIEWAATPLKVTTTKAVYEADQVIITLPLGVLKANTVKFVPALPAAKRQAIQKLGMGILNKCYLHFPKAFWPTTVDWLEQIPSQRGEWAEWVSLMRVAKWPVLLGFNAADHGLAIEKWDDQAIVDSAMQSLRRLFGRTIPDPLGYQLTRWGADPFARGAYSFNALGALPQMRDDLAANLGSKLFFAGEATNREYASTVHGAYLSGVRAAQEVIHAAQR